jgi:hypothetical protein
MTSYAGVQFLSAEAAALLRDLRRVFATHPDLLCDFYRGDAEGGENPLITGLRLVRQARSIKAELPPLSPLELDLDAALETLLHLGVAWRRRQACNFYLFEYLTGQLPRLPKMTPTYDLPPPVPRALNARDRERLELLRSMLTPELRDALWAGRLVNLRCPVQLTWRAMLVGEARFALRTLLVWSEDRGICLRHYGNPIAAYVCGQADGLLAATAPG